MFRFFVPALLLLWLLTCSAHSTGESTGESTGTTVAGCDACHKLARCQSAVLDNSVETVGVVCRCEDGLVGDGFTCYNKTACGDECCDPGYRWSPQLGCVDVDECSLPDPPCGPGQLCQNSLGSFSCLLSPASTQAKATPRSVQFSCGGVVCPDGQDCIEVNGGTRCDDPCHRNYRQHNDWRATNYSGSNSHCDNYASNHWYELALYRSLVRMPERCIEPNKCGTKVPLWLKTPHPAIEEGIVQAEVCGSWNGDCCHYRSNPIYVKACPENYYVYKFAATTECYLAYCADVNTIVCDTCDRHEICVSDDKVHWRCELREETGSLEPELVCEYDQMHLIIKKNLLEKQGLNATSGHLNEPWCNQQADHQEAMWYTVQRSGSTCGNTVESNSTHILYSNTLFLYSTNLNDFRARRVPFTCAFPIRNTTSLDAPIRYQPSAVAAKLVSSGEAFNASIILYRRSDFKEPLPTGPVSLPLGSPLFVMFSLNFDNILTPLVQSCYTTNSRDANDPDRLYLIRNRCPVDFRNVKLISTSPQKARYSMLLFSTRDLYLHCSIGLCEYSSSSCHPWCSRRQARSVGSPYQLAVSVGPISWL